MSTYKTFAVWGAGNLGGRIASALLDRKVPVIILTRPASVGNAQNEQLASKGAQIRPFDFDAREIVIQGEGDGVLSTTGIEDVARFTTYALTTLPREQLEDQSFFIEGDRVTFNGLAAALNEVALAPLRVTHVPRAELIARAAQNPFDRAVRWLV